MKLKGKVVFITGASAGIGAAAAMAFAGEGARLLLAARRAGKLADVASRALDTGPLRCTPSIWMCVTGMPSSGRSTNCPRSGQRSMYW